MGGGDLNMKKSWHPLLMKNQERVWLEEKKALEEKKKLDQLRKEKEEERQLADLQRMQEEQTGKKRHERLDWMYATPASGSGQNPNELEDYLLGKKRVDKILIGDENAKVGASHKNFIAVQNANTQRDILAKVREDPLLAIKQQEQAAYQSLMSNPLRLKQLKEKAGIVKKEKKEKKHKDKDREHRRHKDDRSASPRRRSRSPRRSVERRHKPSYSRSRSRTPERRSRYDDDRRRHSRSPVDDRRDSYRSMDVDTRRRSPVYEPRRRSRSPLPRRRSDSRERHSRDDRYIDDLRRAPTPPSRTAPPGPSRSEVPSRPQQSGPSQGDADRAARLAAMTQSASSLAEDREKRLAALAKQEEAEFAAEEEARKRSAKHGGAGTFLMREKARALMGAGDLADRINRNRAGLVGVD